MDNNSKPSIEKKISLSKGLDSSTKPSKANKGLYGFMGLILIIVIAIAIPYINSLKKTDSEVAAAKSKVEETTKSDSQTTGGTSSSSSQEQKSTPVPVQLTVDKITVTPQNEIEVTITNNTDTDVALPSINFTCNLFQGNVNKGYQVIWLDNLGQSTQTYKSLPVSDDFDSIQPVAYMNILNMDDAGLTTNYRDDQSSDQVRPVFESDIIKVK